MRTLLVEDDALLGDGLRAGLRQAGFEVDWVRDGADAAHAAETESFAAIVLDLGLPNMDGLAVLRRLRARGIKTPILILTARDAVQDRVTGLDAGADDYVVKPVDSWGREVESNAVEVHVHHLRRKLSPRLIRTIRGVGYLMPRDHS
jgi:two-component system OmpR family response regulator/two-component system response regulator QseB